ncbi:MAG: SprT-like domain-containing protein [Bacilli bacterium]|nr:SprT-like domain-containing protein [Bacilli bacterium]
MKISLGNYDVIVKIVYKNNRNIVFRFDENGNLIVSCPHNTLNDEIASLITKNESSLIRMYERCLEQMKYAQEFWYLGNRYDVIFEDGIENAFIEENYIHAKDESMLEDFLKEEMQKVFDEEISICRKCFNNLPDFKLKIRKMKTRWGVCNRHNNTITLNTELIKKKVDLIDYVIIHEMAHFYEGNHSKKFWAIVEKACPNYKLRRKELRK